jgi:hypothetical protein
MLLPAGGASLSALLRGGEGDEAAEVRDHVVHAIHHRATSL